VKTKGAEVKMLWLFFRIFFSAKLVRFHEFGQLFAQKFVKAFFAKIDLSPSCGAENLKE
jgi:hypothetical protein